MSALTTVGKVIVVTIVTASLFFAGVIAGEAEAAPESAGYDWQWLIRVGPAECVEYTGNAGAEEYELEAYYLAPGFTSLEGAAVFAIQAYELQGPMSGSPFLEPCAVPVVRGGAQGVVR